MTNNSGEDLMIIAITETVGPSIAPGTRRRIHNKNGDWTIEKSISGELKMYRDPQLAGVAFMPFLGEFGWFIMDHIRYVHAFEAAYKIVFCEPGQECLFPTASEFRYDWQHPVKDTARRGNLNTLRVIDDVGLVKSLPAGIRPIYPDQHTTRRCDVKFYPEADPQLPVVDIVVAPRYRRRGQYRNYKHWRSVVMQLQALGFTVGVAGNRDTSVDIPGADAYAWEHPNGPTEGTLDLLQRCRLFIGTDSGVTHLAALVSCPTLVISFASRCKNNMNAVIRRVHAGVFRVVEDTWDTSDGVVAAAVDMFRGNTTARITSVGAERIDLVTCSAGGMRRFMPNVAVEILSDVNHRGFTTTLVTQCRDRASREHKILRLRACPTEYGIVLDDDTAVVRPFDNVESVLTALGTDIAMAVDPFVSTVGAVRKHAEQRRWSSVAENDYTTDNFPGIEAKPHFNSGVIFFRNTPTVERLCEVWLQEWQRFKDIDQLALARAIEITGIRVGVLPPELHYRLGQGASVTNPAIAHFTGNKWSAHKWKVNAGVPVGATPNAGAFLERVNGLTGKNEPISQLHTTLLKLAHQLRPRKYGEIGSRYGHSASAVAIASKSTEINCFDFPGAGYGGVNSSDVILRRVMNNTARGRHELKFGDSSKLRDDIVAAGPFDLFLVDGDHSTKACAYDFATALAATQPNGVIVVDDLILHPDLGKWFNTITKTYASRILRVETKLHLTAQEKALKALRRGIGIVYLKPESKRCCGSVDNSGIPAAVVAAPVGVDMSVAGPPLWEELHVYCAEQAYAPRDIITAWVMDEWLQKIPCPECHAAFHRWLATHPIAADPLGWSIQAHNYVNLKRGVAEVADTPTLRARYSPRVSS